MYINSKLVARYISNECNEKEKKLIEKRIQSDPSFARVIKDLQKSTNLQEIPSRPIEIEAKWQQLQQRILLENAKFHNAHTAQIVETFRKSKISHQLLKYAAVFIFAIFLTYFFSKGIFHLPGNKSFAGNYQTVQVHNGERKNITLTDGSIVTVDAGSEFKYFTSFDNERHVYLKGEASFRVAPDKQRPFFVHANHAVVRVVGTRFNVRSWNEDSDDVITVAEGKVAVRRDNVIDSLLTTETVMLTQGEQSNVPAAGPPTQAVQVDAEQYFKWMQNDIHFVDSKVSQVVAQLERWYDYRFVFENRKVLDQTISVHIRGANIEEVIQVISVVTETKVVRKGNQIEFLKN